MIDLQNDYESLISTSNQVEALQKYKINPQFELFLEDSKTKKVSSPQIKNSITTSTTEEEEEAKSASAKVKLYVYKLVLSRNIYFHGSEIFSGTSKYFTTTAVLCSDKIHKNSLGHS